MAKTFHITVAKVGETIFDGEAVSAVLPGSAGVFTVLAGHEALVAELGVGELCVSVPDGEDILVQVEKGVAEVSNGQATVLL